MLLSNIVQYLLYLTKIWLKIRYFGINGRFSGTIPELSFIPISTEFSPVMHIFDPYMKPAKESRAYLKIGGGFTVASP